VGAPEGRVWMPGDEAAFVTVRVAAEYSVSYVRAHL
jgi:hypothetical protein